MGDLEGPRRLGHLFLNQLAPIKERPASFMADLFENFHERTMRVAGPSSAKTYTITYLSVVRNPHHESEAGLVQDGHAECFRDQDLAPPSAE